MADNNFRSDRSRDPLAELARLIGQGDPHAEGGQHQSYGSERSGAGTAAANVDWAAEQSYGARVDERYPAPAAPAASAEEQGYDNEAPGRSRYFSGPAAQFNGFREEETEPYYDEQQQLPPARQLQGYATAPDHGDEADEPGHSDAAYAADDYYDEAPSPRRRSGLVLVMAIFGLAVVGTAGAFGYRAMFGASVLPTLPPIIKASNGPNRVAPAYGDSQTNNANDSKQAGAATTGSTENLVSREEQPVTIEPPKAVPRVVSTIPVITQGAGQGSMPPGMGTPAPPGQAMPNQGAPGHVASAADSPWPPPTAAPSQAPAAAPMPAPAPPPGSVSSEPKKIHTVTIRADQSSGADAAPASTASAAYPGARAQSRTAVAPRVNAPPSGPNAPLSIVPGSQGGAPAPQRTRMTAAPTGGTPTAVANTSSVPAAAPSSGGYAVQVTSQRSEGEAQTVYRALQAKYPGQLSGRAPIIRRADLAEKGTFYRALVGPFGSSEEAAGLCSGLKAAGGNCIVQRN
jgi:SPOR domain